MGNTMNRETFCQKMRQEVAEHTNGRSDSSAFLIWFLENFFRLETDEAIGDVCDNPNDKGIDGIYVDDEDEVIYLFQSKFSPSDNQDQGDNDVRNFVGSRQWFENETAVQNLLSSSASEELKSIVREANIIEKTNYKKISVFVTNRIFNRHAKEYIGVTQNLEAYDSEYLFDKYTYFADEEIDFPPVDLLVANQTKIDYNLPDGTEARVYAIRARELLRLQGIQDRTLFYKNVRYGVGNTRVNKDIRSTIEQTAEHDKFFLYHNGISIVCENLVEDLTHNKITLSGYAIVNGCQSMLSFFENRDKLSNNLFVLVKIIKINSTSPLIKEITHNANNQNSISLRDLRSNDSVQRALQREFEEVFDGAVLYRRKRGEPEEGFDYVIDKDFAAQCIEAVYLGNPHNTHLKQKMFGEDYTAIFSRKINAEKIYLASLIYDVVKENAGLLQNERIRDYGLSLFFFSHVLSEIMREDDIGAAILNNPRSYVTDQKTILTRTLTRLWELITPDINIDIEEYGESNGGFFDYKNVFKNSQFVKTMSRKIKSDYIRLIRRNSSDSFSNIFKSFSEQQ
jgi:hypothetical protein